ncbi:putative RecA/RadA family phage recombinase [Novosphingobium fluoreni]|uniref:Putative RecA/RadA family phage recombinase n=1 Tax=Novosphingobium fluoreni TaxID=1391222 RepID=A0A7W6BZD6_9SPHN|nr:DUF2190 family protein [Novosphingobium fluoreni]MBB3940699.1 putative RecA/RadA family phage recombinase [Novosphingobium fluoreni]
MKNFNRPAINLPVIAPYDVKSGDGMLDGVEFSVAANDASAGASVTGVTEGAFELKKAAVSITRKTIAYWDNTAKVVTNVSSGNSKIGIFQAGALSGDATVLVKLIASI